MQLSQPSASRNHAIKFPLRHSLKASFLHDEEIDWDALGTLEDSARDGAASPKADELDGTAAKNYLEGLKSEHDAGDDKAGDEARKVDGSGSSGRRRSSVTFDDLNDSLRSCGLGSHPGSISELGRRPSASTLAASHSSKSRSPHELAAAVAKEAKDDFAKKLPSSLCKEFDRRDVVAPYSSKEIVLGPLLGKGEFSHVFEIRAFRPEPQLESCRLCGWCSGIPRIGQVSHDGEGRACNRPRPSGDLSFCWRWRSRDCCI